MEQGIRDRARAKGNRNGERSSARVKTLRHDSSCSARASCGSRVASTTRAQSRSIWQCSCFARALRAARTTKRRAVRRAVRISFTRSASRPKKRERLHSGFASSLAVPQALASSVLASSVLASSVLASSVLASSVLASSVLPSSPRVSTKPNSLQRSSQHLHEPRGAMGGKGIAVARCPLPVARCPLPVARWLPVTGALSLMPCSGYPFPVARWRRTY
jgi:hypothetical protein